MSRLTYKRGRGILVENNIEYGTLTNVCYQDCVDKLGQLEDIEEEFEIESIEDLRDRLTKYKFLANHEMSCVDANAYNLMLEDLNKYHSIEDELGIDLITLFNKATKEVWYKEEIIEYDVGGNWYKELDRNTIIHNSIVSRLDFQYKQVYIKGVKQWFNIKDYGKTWALTREELL